MDAKQTHVLHTATPRPPHSSSFSDAPRAVAFIATFIASMSASSTAAPQGVPPMPQMWAPFADRYNVIKCKWPFKKKGFTGVVSSP